MESVIGGLNLSFILTRAADWQSSKLTKKANKLRDYIMGLLGFGHLLSKKREEAIQSFERYEDEMRLRYEAANETVEKKFKLPTWATVLLSLPLGIPYGIMKLVKEREREKTRQQITDDLISEYCAEIDSIYDILSGLKNLQNIIEKKELIQTVLTSLPRGFSAQSVQEEVQRVGAVYGQTEWEKRISLIATKIIRCEGLLVLQEDLVQKAANLLTSINHPETEPGNFMQQVTEQCPELGIDTPLFRAQLAAALLQISARNAVNR